MSVKIVRTFTTSLVLTRFQAFTLAYTSVTSREGRPQLTRCAFYKAEVMYDSLMLVFRNLLTVPLAPKSLEVCYLGSISDRFLFICCQQNSVVILTTVYLLIIIGFINGLIVTCLICLVLYLNVCIFIKQHRGVIKLEVVRGINL